MANKKGDTIVEVMIAIAVLGGVIGAAFAVANSGTRQTYANQERYQAQLLANAQAEQLRIVYETYVNIPTNIRGGFAATKPTGPVVCLAGNVWSTSGCVVDGLYNINVTDISGDAGSVAGSPITYSIEVKWTDLASGKESRAELLYGL